MLLSEHLEQIAIEELRKENDMLKDKLQEINWEMQGLKEANHQAVGTHLSLKIPPNISVSCLCTMGSYYEQQCITYFIFLVGICEGLALALQTGKSISPFSKWVARTDNLNMLVSIQSSLCHGYGAECNQAVKNSSVTDIQAKHTSIQEELL